MKFRLFIALSFCLLSSATFAAEKTRTDLADEMPWLADKENILVTFFFEPHEQAAASSNHQHLFDTINNFLQKQATNRIQVNAYASPRAQSPVQARQISLKRAISIRKQLINNGTNAQRIIIRALGSNTTSKHDRADVFAL